MKKTATLMLALGALIGPLLVAPSADASVRLKNCTSEVQHVQVRQYGSKVGVLTLPSWGVHYIQGVGIELRSVSPDLEKAAQPTQPFGDDNWIGVPGFDREAGQWLNTRDYGEYCVWEGGRIRIQRMSPRHHLD